MLGAQGRREDSNSDSPCYRRAYIHHIVTTSHGYDTGIERAGREREAILQWSSQSCLWSRDGTLGQSAHQES